MLRIALIIAIVAGIAAAVLNFVQVQKVIKTAVEERDQQKTEKEANLKGWNEAKASLKKTEGELATTKKTLATTESSLKKETARANEQEKHAKDIASKLSKAETERDESQRMLAQWKDVGITPGQVKALIADNKKLKEAKDVMGDENRILAKTLRAKSEELARLIGTEERPPAMPGVKGKVVAVDPKYDFVVLDIGGNQGVLERGEMLVNRNGKLVGKVKVFSVDQNRSIANVLPGWKNADVMEGDQVLY